MMGIEGARVLVDAYTIELAQGTGLKTYALGVVHALKRLGARPGLLVSSGVSEDPILQEALLLDASRGKAGLPARMPAIMWALTPFHTARPVARRRERL